MIIVFTGDGKGKTEAAFGLALRALGNGLKVSVVQFMKTEEWKSGEREALRTYSIPLDVYVMGAGFCWDKPKMYKSHKEAASHAWNKVKELFERGYDMVICDEINVAISLKLLDENEVLDFVSKLNKDKHICLTGRNAPLKVIEEADYVKAFVSIQHPFDMGIKAIRGIDF